MSGNISTMLPIVIENILWIDNLQGWSVSGILQNNGLDDCNNTHKYHPMLLDGNYWIQIIVFSKSVLQAVWDSTLSDWVWARSGKLVVNGTVENPFGVCPQSTESMWGCRGTGTSPWWSYR